LELPSAGTLGFTVLPGFLPGFFLGRPAAVSGTLGVGSVGWCCCMMENRATELGSTMISSISMLARPALRTRVGELGSDSGGDDSDGDEL
jgi:hypothetical protein